MSHFGLAQNGFSHLEKMDNKSVQFGYVDKGDSIIIPFKFQYAYDFVNDYAIIIKNDLFGLINKKGENVIPAEYHSLYLLPNGKSIAKKDNQWYYLNENGLIIHHFKYDFIGEISEKTSWIAICRTGLDWSILDTNLNEIQIKNVDFIFTFEDGIGLYLQNQYFGLLNTFGQKLTDPVYNHMKKIKNGKIFYTRGQICGFFNDQGLEICTREMNGYIDDIQIINDSIVYFESDGQEIIINSNCDSIFNDALKFDDYINTNYKIKYFNKNAEIIKNVDRFYVVKINGKVGLYDQFGLTLIPPIYDMIEPNYQCLEMFVVRNNNKFGLYSLNHKILETEYNTVQLNGLCFLLEKNNKFGACNLKGDIIIPIEFDYIGYESNDLIIVVNYNNKNNKVGYYNKNGEIVIPLIYDDGTEFHEGFAAIKLNGKWGYINYSGKIVIPLEYEAVTTFKENRAVIKKGNFYGVIDSKGNNITDIKYSYIGEFYDGIAVASINSEYGYLNYDGKEITPFIYSSCRHFSCGYGEAYKLQAVYKINTFGEIIKE